MKIVFNLQSVGLGNNGGSRTLIKCAEAIQELGHEVSLWSSANNYKWGKIKVPVLQKMPKCDVLIATGYRSVPSTVSAKVKRKFYYIRGFELWQASEKKLLNSYRSLNCIVNSEWLKIYLKEQKIQSELVYPGLDFDDFYIDPDADGKEHSLGGLFSKKHKTKRHDDIFQVGKMVGCKPVLLNRNLVHPTPKQLRKFYSSIKVWMAPTELEGLHNCPMEASLCGCAIVATDHIRNGMHDYLDHTALVYPARDLDACGDYVEKLLRDEDFRKELNDRMNSLLKTKIGSRQYNMKRMIQIFQKEG